MTTRLLAFVTFVLTTTVAHAQPAHYWGTLPDDPARGLIELDGRLHSVRVGDVLPGRGTVRAVDNEEVVVVHTLSDAEKLELAAQGYAVIDARQEHLRNVQRLLPLPERIR
jgi:hypothetical protein